MSNTVPTHTYLTLSQVTPSLVHSSVSWQKCIHAARSCVLRTKHSSSLMLLFLDEAKTKRHGVKERCQQRFVNYYTGQTTEGSKDLSAVCVCSICLCVTHVTQGQDVLCWVVADGGGALYIYFILLWLFFLASRLGGKTWLSRLRNGVLASWCFRCCFDWRSAHRNTLAHNEASEVVFMFASGTLLVERHCLLIDCFDMWGPLQQTSCCAFWNANWGI